MQFSTVIIGLVAMAFVAAPVLSSPADPDAGLLVDMDFGNDFEESMLPDFNMGTNEFAIPEGMKIVTDTTLAEATGGFHEFMMTMVTEIGATGTEYPTDILPTATGTGASTGAGAPTTTGAPVVEEGHKHDHDHGEMGGDYMYETYDIRTHSVSLPVFTYESLSGTESPPDTAFNKIPVTETGSAMSVPTNGSVPTTSRLLTNGTIPFTVTSTDRTTLMTSAIPTSTNGTITLPSPPTLSNSASGNSPLLAYAGAISALVLAILAL